MVLSVLPQRIMKQVISLDFLITMIMIRQSVLVGVLADSISWTAVPSIITAFRSTLLGWIDPPVIREGAHDIYLGPSSEFPDAVIVMPQGSDGSYSEFFMVQTRNPARGNDNCSVSWWNWQGTPEWTSPGLALWHIDASLNEGGDFRYDNSFSPHKMVRLMEADGLEELEQSCDTRNIWDPADLYYPGQLFGSDTIPNSSAYDGSITGIRIDQITQQGSGMRMRITIPSSNPPSVSTITNLSNMTFATDFITWNWTDPTDSDFDHVMVYLDDTFQANITKGSQQFSATGLLSGTSYTIRYQDSRPGREQQYILGESHCIDKTCFPHRRLYRQSPDRSSSHFTWCSLISQSESLIPTTGISEMARSHQIKTQCTAIRHRESIPLL